MSWRKTKVKLNHATPRSRFFLTFTLLNIQMPCKQHTSVLWLCSDTVDSCGHVPYHCCPGDKRVIENATLPSTKDWYHLASKLNVSQTFFIYCNGMFSWRSKKKQHCINKTQQETPPAWTQEAYRPPRSKCPLCCSVQAGGTVSWPGGGDLILTWSEGVLRHGIARGYPSTAPLPERTWERTWDWGPHGIEVPPLKWPGTRDLGKNLGLGYSPAPVLIDRHLWKHCPPSYHVRRR